MGATVVWTYEVHNESGSPLHQVAVLDDDGGGTTAVPFAPVFVGGDTNANGLLDVGEVWRYTSAGVRTYRVQAGAYVNVATVTALTLAGDALTDDDAAHLLGTGTQLVVEKAVNAVDPTNPDSVEDADFPTGPYLTIGSTVTWTYRVFVVGLGSVTGVVLRDDNGSAGAADDFAPVYLSGDLGGDGVLNPGEVWLYRATGIVREGQYTNIATVTGVSGGETLTDTDPANYYGVVRKVQIEKAVNAANPTAPTLADDADTATVAKTGRRRLGRGLDLSRLQPDDRQPAQHRRRRRQRDPG